MELAFRICFHLNVFQELFINRFADHINSTFSAAHVTPIVIELREIVAPYLADDSHRWSRNFFHHK